MSSISFWGGLVDLKCGQNIHLYFSSEDVFPTSEEKYYYISACNGIAHCFPPFESKLISSKYPTTLSSYLKVNHFKLVVSSTSSTPSASTPASTSAPSSRYVLIKDPLKLIIWDLGITALYCLKNNIKLDLNTTLKTIFVGEDEYPRVKAIAISGNAGDNWREDLKAVYEKIKETCQINDPGFAQFLKRMASTYLSPSKFREHLRSHFFWSKYDRMDVICKLGEFVDNYPHMFIRSLSSDCLLRWRSVMESDTKMTSFVQSKARQNALPQSNTFYEAEEIDCLLVLLRSSMAHFETMAKGLFTSKDEMLEYLDTNFVDLMNGIYQRATEMEDKKLIEFSPQWSLKRKLQQDMEQID